MDVLTVRQSSIVVGSKVTRIELKPTPINFSPLVEEKEDAALPTSSDGCDMEEVLCRTLRSTSSKM